MTTSVEIPVDDKTLLTFEAETVARFSAAQWSTPRAGITDSMLCNTEPCEPSIDDCTGTGCEPDLTTLCATVDCE